MEQDTGEALADSKSSDRYYRQPIETPHIPEEYFRGRYGNFFHRLHERLQLSSRESRELEELLNGTRKSTEEAAVRSIYQRHENQKRQIMTQISRNYQNYNEFFGFTNEIYKQEQSVDEIDEPEFAEMRKAQTQQSKSTRWKFANLETSSSEKDRRKRYYLNNMQLLECINCARAGQREIRTRREHIQQLLSDTLTDGSVAKAIHDMYELKVETIENVRACKQAFLQSQRQWILPSPSINDLSLDYYQHLKTSSSQQAKSTEFTFAWLQLVGLINGMESAAMDILVRRIAGANKPTVENNANLMVRSLDGQCFELLNALHYLPLCRISQAGDGAEVVLPPKSTDSNISSYVIPLRNPLASEEYLQPFRARMTLAILALQKRLELLIDFYTQIPSADTRLSLVKRASTEERTLAGYNYNPFGSPKEGDTPASEGSRTRLPVEHQPCEFSQCEPNETTYCIRFGNRLTFPFGAGDLLDLLRPSRNQSKANEDSWNFAMKIATHMIICSVNALICELQAVELLDSTRRPMHQNSRTEYNRSTPPNSPSANQETARIEKNKALEK